MMTTTLISQRSTYKPLYLVLAIVGSIAPWIFFIQFLQQGSVSINSFLAGAFANPVASIFAADLVISCVVFSCFSFIELKRLGLSRRWLALYIGLILGVGLSCSLPLFFYLRETRQALR